MVSLSLTIKLTIKNIRYYARLFLSILLAFNFVAAVYKEKRNEEVFVVSAGFRGKIIIGVLPITQLKPPGRVVAFDL